MPTEAATAARVVGWSAWDGAGKSEPTTGDSDHPPYETGTDALRDGWRLLQAAQLVAPQPGHEYDASFVKHEFWFEKLA